MYRVLKKLRKMCTFFRDTSHSKNIPFFSIRTIKTVNLHKNPRSIVVIDVEIIARCKHLTSNVSTSTIEMWPDWSLACLGETLCVCVCVCVCVKHETQRERFSRQTEWSVKAATCDFSTLSVRTFTFANENLTRTARARSFSSNARISRERENWLEFYNSSLQSWLRLLRENWENFAVFGKRSEEKGGKLFPPITALSAIITRMLAGGKTELPWRLNARQRTVFLRIINHFVNKRRLFDYRLWPTYASAHNNLGTLTVGDQAEQHFLAAIHAQPGHVNAHYNLGQLYRSVDNRFHFVKEMPDEAGNTSHVRSRLIDSIEINCWISETDTDVDRTFSKRYSRSVSSL